MKEESVKMLRVTREQLLAMTDFMEKNVELARGSLVCSSQKAVLWDELARTLNSCQKGPKRDPVHWARTWYNYKIRVRKREIKVGKLAWAATKGRQARNTKVPSLTHVEQRLLVVLRDPKRLKDARNLDKIRSSLENPPPIPSTSTPKPRQPRVFLQRLQTQSTSTSANMFQSTASQTPRALTPPSLLLPSPQPSTSFTSSSSVSLPSQPSISAQSPPFLKSPRQPKQLHKPLIFKTEEGEPKKKLSLKRIRLSVPFASGDHSSFPKVSCSSLAQTSCTVPQNSLFPGPSSSSTQISCSPLPQPPSLIEASCAPLLEAPSSPVHQSSSLSLQQNSCATSLQVPHSHSTEGLGSSLPQDPSPSLPQNPSLISPQAQSTCLPTASSSSHSVPTSSISLEPPSATSSFSTSPPRPPPSPGPSALLTSSFPLDGASPLPLDSNTILSKAISQSMPRASSHPSEPIPAAPISPKSIKPQLSSLTSSSSTLPQSTSSSSLLLVEPFPPTTTDTNHNPCLPLPSPLIYHSPSRQEQLSPMETATNSSDESDVPPATPSTNKKIKQLRETLKSLKVEIFKTELQLALAELEQNDSSLTNNLDDDETKPVFFTEHNQTLGGMVECAVKCVEKLSYSMELMAERTTTTIEKLSASVLLSQQTMSEALECIIKSFKNK